MSCQFLADKLSMPKLVVIKAKELIKKLEKLGFVVDHQSGSHVVMYRFSDKKRAVVPISFKEISNGTLLAILRETGLSKQDII